jgi:hypothetical protein
LATSFSPFFLKYGRHLFIPTAPWKSLIDNPMAREFAETLSRARQHMYNALHDAATSMKQFADQKQEEAPLYAIGQKVWLDARNI